MCGGSRKVVISLHAVLSRLSISPIIPSPNNHPSVRCRCMLDSVCIVSLVHLSVCQSTNQSALCLIIIQFDHQSISVNPNNCPPVSMQFVCLPTSSTSPSAFCLIISQSDRQSISALSQFKHCENRQPAPYVNQPINLGVRQSVHMSIYP